MLRSIVATCLVAAFATSASADERVTVPPVKWGKRVVIHLSVEVTNLDGDTIASYEPTDRTVAATSKELARLRAVADASVGTWKLGDKNPPLEDAVKAAFPDARFTSTHVKWAIDEEFLCNVGFSDWKITPKLRVSSELLAGQVRRGDDSVEISFYGGCKVPGRTLTYCRVRYSARAR